MRHTDTVASFFSPSLPPLFFFSAPSDRLFSSLLSPTLLSYLICSSVLFSFFHVSSLAALLFVVFSFFHVSSLPCSSLRFCCSSSLLFSFRLLCFHCCSLLFLFSALLYSLPFFSSLFISPLLFSPLPVPIASLSLLLSSLPLLYPSPFFSSLLISPLRFSPLLVSHCRLVTTYVRRPSQQRKGGEHTDSRQRSSLALVGAAQSLPAASVQPVNKKGQRAMRPCQCLPAADVHRL